MIPIVLTGTIIPNAIKVVHCDWRKRRTEYLDAIKFYKKFSKVYFIENSHYDLLYDSAFSNDERFQCFKFEASKEFERGKGYQEFEMLDEFVKAGLEEDSFIKVTGRYIYKNFGKILSLIMSEDGKYELVIDTFIRRKVALTTLFYVRRETYLQHFQDRYLEMDDSKGIWAEHVIYRILKNVGSYACLPRAPILNAISGSTGETIRMNDHGAKLRVKDVQRILFRALNIKQLLR